MDTQSPKLSGCPVDAQPSLFRKTVSADEIEKIPDKPIDRRTLLKVGGMGAMATTLASVGSLAWMPKRVGAAPSITFPDIQFDIGAFVHPAQTIAGVPVQFGVTYTFMAPAALTRNPSKGDQQVLANALATIEAHYSFSPSGIFTLVAYGLPYFNRLPGSLVASRMPRLSSNHSRFVLEEAVPSPTDVHASNPTVSKTNFNVPVRIEHNDVLFTLRSDSLFNIFDVYAWLNGSGVLNGNFVSSPAFHGLFNFATPRLNFVQPGLPRQVADIAGLSYANEINPTSSMWMGFVDQQVNGSAPNGATVTFAGSSHAHLTTAVPGSYFDNGSIIHLSHVIDDLGQFYNKDANAGPVEDFSERVQYMFRSKTNGGAAGLPFPQDPNDAFTNGGGLGAATGGQSTQQKSAFLQNINFGINDQDNNFDPDLLAQGTKQYRVGHLCGLQRSSRAADGTPLHIRNDGPGFSSMDVPDGSTQPTLEFLVFVPTAEFFRVMRVNSASVDYVKLGDQGGTQTSVDTAAGELPSDSEDDGLERFLTATRRQNFLIPPRRHRSFPLLELT
ncbi:MAG TPA: hypothetical protein VFV38_25480 [Ktedonobacteraceae bacterium]|nr:hypothetical protein [Ktedonobacteraceae bacterium]